MICVFCGMLKDVYKFKKHREDFVHERENALGERLQTAGLDFEILSLVADDSLLINKELRAAGVQHASDRIKISKAVKDNDMKEYSKILHIRQSSSKSMSKI